MVLGRRSKAEEPSDDALAILTNDEGVPDSDAAVAASTAEQEPREGSADPRAPAPRAHRIVWLVAGVAVVSLVAGIVVSRFIISPAQAAANAAPPVAGLVTVPIEKKIVSNTVTMRADVTYDDAVDVTVDTASLPGRAIVTGQVPAVGAVLGTAAVALEIMGRPVIVLPGQLPAYRSLSVGMSGHDVTQLKGALTTLGIDVGDASSSVYDATTAAAVDALYSRVGYSSPKSAEGTTSATTSAADEVASARSALDTAKVALDQKLTGVSQATRVEQDNLVGAAQRDLAEAEAGGDPRAVVDKKDAIALALATRDAAFATPDARAEQVAVSAAGAALVRAQEALSTAQEEALTPLPASEVLFLTALPRRVDEVSITRGSTLVGSAMKVSGATLTMKGTASTADKNLLSAGMAASFELPDGAAHGAKIVSIDAAGTPAATGQTTKPSAKPAHEATGFTVTLAPDRLSDEQIQALKGTNVKLSIPVSSTDGEVLAVPLAALTAGPGGESRVEVQKDAETSVIGASTGLAAEGYVEITGSASPLAAGDRVVVGRGEEEAK